MVRQTQQFFLLFWIFFAPIGSAFVAPSMPTHHVTTLQAALKPAAIPLMDSGKALARSGELLIDVTTTLDLYGGSLSAMGALIRNSGDAIAQAAASCRFKTGTELVSDELREGATCLAECNQKAAAAMEEAGLDEMADLLQTIGA